MDGYGIVNLAHMIEELGEDRVKAILSSFACPLNPDVEKFIHNSAIPFARQQISATHLIIGNHCKKMKFLAYFTVTTKSMYIQKNKISKNLSKKITKFGKYIKEMKRYEIPAPLIAQLGKNYNDGLNDLITGDEILKLACDKIATAQEAIGGKVVYLECEDKPKLIQFYQDNGFVEFDRRPLDKDETDLSGTYLVQMLKIQG